MNPQIDLYSQLAQLFHLGYRFIKAKNTDKPQWETIGKYQLKSGGFIKDYASTLFLLGVGFGASTFYTMLDIDINSPYHPANNSKAFQKLLHTLEKKGLTHPVLIQSSNSGGIHIYYFFPKKLHTFRVASFIHVTLINAGFKFKPGHLESFPNPKPYTTNGKFSNYNRVYSRMKILLLIPHQRPNLTAHHATNPTLHQQKPAHLRVIAPI